MAKLADKLWNWGHLEGSHNKLSEAFCNCSMTPEQFAKEYGIKNAFIVSYGGNICPPFDEKAKRFSGLQRIKWSVLGDASTPLPEERLGYTDAVIDAARIYDNITGGVVDDFFSPKRMERFTPEVLMEIKQALNARGLDFWCVLYDLNLHMDLEKYIKCFDGISFWIWESKNIVNVESYLEKVFALAGDKPVMGGIYLWDFSGNAECGMESGLFEKQLKHYFELLLVRKLEGVIICSGTIGDADLETNRILKKYIAEYGDREIQ